MCVLAVVNKKDVYGYELNSILVKTGIFQTTVSSAKKIAKQRISKNLWQAI